MPPLPTARASTSAFVLTGVAQALIFVGYAYVASVIFETGFTWIESGARLLDVYLRAVVFGAVAFVVACTIPIAAKWILIGRWKRQRIRLWSPAYLRFLGGQDAGIGEPPLVLFAGSPLYNM